MSATLCGCMLTENFLIAFNYFSFYENYGNFTGFYVFTVESLFAILVISYANPPDKQLIPVNGIRDSLSRYLRFLNLEYSFGNF